MINLKHYFVPQVWLTYKSTGFKVKKCVCLLAARG